MLRAMLPPIQTLFVPVRECYLNYMTREVELKVKFQSGGGEEGLPTL